MDDRNSALFFVLPIFESSSSIASTGDRGVSTLRSIHTVESDVFLCSTRRLAFSASPLTER